MGDDGLRTTTELMAAGVPRTTINHRCRTGRWTRLLPGVVALGDVDDELRCRAVLRWQPRAVLSHRTAAWWWGWCAAPEVVEVTVPRTANVRGPDWLALHRRRLGPESVLLSRGLPVVSPARVVLDCATVLPDDEADVVVDRAVQDGLDLRTLARQCLVDAGVAGLVGGRRQLREAAVGVRSEPERLVARALARRGWRIPANASVHGWVCDFADEPSATVVEIDGREVHSQPVPFRRDRRRQNALLEVRHVLRYAAADALEDPDEVAEDILRVVRRRRAARR